MRPKNVADTLYELAVIEEKLKLIRNKIREKELNNPTNSWGEYCVYMKPEWDIEAKLDREKRLLIRLIRAIDFDALSSRTKWDIWEKILKVEWVCGKCGRAYETKGEGDYWDGKRESIKRTMGVIECGFCGNVLTHRTNGGQSDPFDWSFINKKP